MNITVDVDALRDYMEDRAGSAAFSGFPAAILDVMDIEDMDGYDLCRKAESEGVDLCHFAVDDDDIACDDDDEW